MQLQKAMAHNPRIDVIVEGIQMVSGLLLVVFLWTHMVFVAAIWLGVNAFNTLAHFMDVFGLLPATVVFLILVIGAHIGAVIRRVPRQWQEQKILWRHAKLIHHSDTWSWLFQAITGVALLALVIVHIAVVTYGGINANLSSSRVHGGFLVFLRCAAIALRIPCERRAVPIFVKWGWVGRHSLKRVLTVISLRLSSLAQ